MNRELPGLREALADDGPILLALCSLSLVLLTLLAFHGLRGLVLEAWSENLVLYLVALCTAATIAGVWSLLRARPVSPVRYMLDLITKPETLSALAGGIPMLIAMVMWVPIFSATKSAIPVFHPYSWDASLARADRFLFGNDAWRVLQPYLGHPLITSLLAYTYHAWIVLIYGGGVYFAFFVRNRELRAQYFIGRFAVWSVLGLGVATAFSSVGPCFVGPIMGSHRFDPLMAYLNSANTHYPVLVLPVQQSLLDWYLAGHEQLGGGIAAMPSLHVSMTLLNALAVWRLSRAWGIAAYVSVAIIFLGSIHLGYHYAVDGLVSIVGTMSLWALAGMWAAQIVRKNSHLPASLAGPAKTPSALG